MRLDGRVVIVTGASSGIGGAVARHCLEEGASVVASGRRAEPLADLAAASERVAPIVGDLTADGVPEALVAAAHERFGRLDGLVHAAGTVRRNEDLRTTTDADLATFLDGNLTAAIRVARAVFGALVDGGGGSIVLVASQLAHIAAPGYASYSAAKGAIVSFARALAVDGGPAGVRSNVVSPGLVRTPMAYVDRPDFDVAEPQIAARHPLRRIGEPRDIAGPCVFLLSDESSFITGQTLIVDGGFTAQ